MYAKTKIFLTKFTTFIFAFQALKYFTLFSQTCIIRGGCEGR